MNLFLKNGSSSKNNNPLIPKLNNKFKINTPSKANINYRNKKTLFNSKDKLSSLYLRMSNKSLKKYEIMQTEYSNNNQTNILSKTIDKNNHINQKLIKSEENKNKSEKSLNNFNNHNRNMKSDFNPKKEKILINLKKRYSVFNKGHQNLENIYGLSSLPTTQRLSLKGNPSLHETFFTSIPIDNNIHKRNSQNSKISFSKFKLRKENYNTIKLKELKNQIQKFESSENFQPNEKIIEKYLSSPERFINEKYTKTINLKKRIKININDKPKLRNKKIIYSIPNTKSNKSKILYNKINNIHKESDINKTNVKRSKSGNNYEKTNKILKNAFKKINLLNDEVTEYLKEIAIEYKKEIGEFTFYNGKGIYSNHLAILKKNENLLAFMLTNELCNN